MKSIFYLILVLSKSDAGITFDPPSRGKSGLPGCEPISYNIGMIPYGETVYLSKPCIRVTCHITYVSEIASCGAVALKRNCKFTKPPDESYPHCCPQAFVCTPVKKKRKRIKY